MTKYKYAWENVPSTNKIFPKLKGVDHTDWEPAFSLSKQQKEAARDWIKSHNEEKHGGSKRNTGAIGGAFTWKFTDTSLGTVTKIKCSCGEGLDVSNYNEW